MPLVFHESTGFHCIKDPKNKEDPCAVSLTHVVVHKTIILDAILRRGVYILC